VRICATGPAIRKRNVADGELEIERPREGEDRRERGRRWEKKSNGKERKRRRAKREGGREGVVAESSKGKEGGSSRAQGTKEQASDCV